MGASGVAAHGLRSYGPMGSAATQHAGPSRTRNQTSVRPHCKANSQSLDHQRSSLFAILVFPFFFFLSVSFSKLMFLLLPISLLQNYLATRGLTWKNMLTESLGALQRGVFLLSGKPCCAYLPPTDGGVFQGHLCLWSSGPSCLSTHWQHCLLAFPCSLLQPLPTLAETDRKVLIL